MDDERLHISLHRCQDRLKTCLIVQYGVSEAVSMKTPVFLRCLTLSGWFDCIGILYSSIRVGRSLRNYGNALVKRQISKKAFSPPTQNCSSSFFFLLSFSASLVLKWLMLASCYGQITSYIVFMWVQVYLWLPENILANQVLIAIDFVVYRLLLCSRTTHAELLTFYGYMMATRILRRSQSVLCCRTLVTFSSHFCLCMHHVALL